MQQFLTSATTTVVLTHNVVHYRPIAWNCILKCRYSKCLVRKSAFKNRFSFHRLGKNVCRNLNYTVTRFITYLHSTQYYVMLHTTLVLIAYGLKNTYSGSGIVVPLMREGRSRSSRNINGGRELAKNRTTVTGLSNFQPKIKHKCSIIQLAKPEFQSRYMYVVGITPHYNLQKFYLVLQHQHSKQFW